MLVAVAVVLVQQPPVPEVQVGVVLEQQTVQHPAQQEQMDLVAEAVVVVELQLMVLIQMVLMVVQES